MTRTRYLIVAAAMRPDGHRSRCDARYVVINVESATRFIRGSDSPSPCGACHESMPHGGAMSNPDQNAGHPHYGGVGTTGATQSKPATPIPWGGTPAVPTRRTPTRSAHRGHALVRLSEGSVPPNSHDRGVREMGMV